MSFAMWLLIVAATFGAVSASSDDLRKNHTNIKTKNNNLILNDFGVICLNLSV